MQRRSEGLPTEKGSLICNQSLRAKVKDTINYEDQIYGNIDIQGSLADIITSNEFGRLQNIKQLGVNYVCFPTATHTRFEHGIGTSYATDKLLKSLENAQKPELEMEGNDHRNIITAALCHDLGHGPFSHTFDNNFITKRFPELQWSHEQCSADLFEYLVDANNIDEYTKEDIKFIQSLILGNSETPKAWMYDIVNNKRNSVDIDKFDYLQRDTTVLSLDGMQFDHSVLTSQARVYNDQIGYPYQNQKDLWRLFECRFELFDKVYLSNNGLSAELLIGDILEESNEYFKFHEGVQDIEQYGHLDDNILEKICTADDSSLVKAKELVDKFYNNEVYSFVACYEFSADKLSTYEAMTPENIAGYSDNNLLAEHIRVQICKITYSLGDKNPMDYITFIDSASDSGIKEAGQDLIEETGYNPKYSLKVFTTDRDRIQDGKLCLKKALKHLTGKESLFTNPSPTNSQ